jgi:DNA polymerase II large subunit
MKYVSDILGTPEQYNCIKFTHNTEVFDQGPKESIYKTITNMTDKVDRQAKLEKKILAVDEKDALERLMHYHFFPDIIGNTRAFARQKLRCVKCNSKYRRIPLSGKCTCGGKLILTISEGSIRKYINVAKKLVKEYELKTYLDQRLDLCEQEINSLFYNLEDKNQKALSDFF